MAVNFLDPETTQISNGELPLAGQLSALKKSEIASVIKSSKQSTGIELRMLPPLIKDNHTPAVWPFPGYARLYCLTIVVSDASNQLAGAIDLKGFPRIGDNERLPINKTIYYWQHANASDAAPDQVHVMCSIMKSKKSLREAGGILASIKEDKDYKSLVGNLAKMGKDLAAMTKVTGIMMEIASIAGRYLKDVEDKPLGTIMNSYTTLHGDFDKIGISPLTYMTRDVDFDFQMVVRKQKEEVAISRKLDGTRGMLPRNRNINLAVQETETVEVDMQPL